MTLLKGTVAGSFYAAGPFDFGDIPESEWAQAFATRMGVDVEEVTDVWETSPKAEHELGELLTSREQMAMFRDN